MVCRQDELVNIRRYLPHWRYQIAECCLLNVLGLFVRSIYGVISELNRGTRARTCCRPQDSTTRFLLEEIKLS
ncbi:hypothetical protein BDZ94DRAFT_1245160 [Collybia nuda]|uniref:Uncharacterized protein n=1 Tax=Collybia nuda TaxID=64659 RepID=A0A9P6CQG9_9AGAR|nr:hypothetical protein BDZ94DRAFT_1245160 [Collybia nuda]